jgi:hypothetical protein
MGVRHDRLPLGDSHENGPSKEGEAFVVFAANALKLRQTRHKR